ncbi:MAG: hypothetical protein PVJ55_02565 [Anaerolineae bacterium]|jgi:hypothetical protein
MDERQYYGKEEEKAEKEREKHEKENMTLDEKWRRDPLSAAVWAVILIWAGLVLLADNLGFFGAWEWVEAWGLILTGAGLIVLLEAALRLIVPAYRRPIGGTLIWGAILLGLGLGNLVGASIAWPLILIAIGVGLLLRGLLRT